MSLDRAEVHDALIPLLLSFAASDSGRSLDEAFIWEPEILARPLITFGSMRRLLAVVKPDLPACFDAHVEVARSLRPSEFR